MSIKSHFKAWLIFAFILLRAIHSDAQNLNLIPYPKQVQILKGNCVVYNTALYTNNKRLSALILYFNEQISPDAKNSRKPKQYIDLKVIPSLGGHGSYILTTFQKQVTIKAPDSSGLFNGLTTLLQLYRSARIVNGKLTLPRLIIHDKPRFAWRGFLLDESRHFFGKSTVKELLNWMAFYKLNRFHWHLTDSHGWRLEIKKYPLLTTIGGRGNFNDSLATATYYTQNDIREIVRYAKERFITIIPEIDMPGHATAANHAYPAFSGGDAPGYPDFTFNAGKDQTYSYISDILKEVKALFPSGLIHIGGDEVALGITAWEKNPDVIKLMAAQKLTDLNQVEHYFLKRVGDSVIKSGSNLMCWDEAVSADLPVKNTYVNWWRQNKPESLNEAISKGYKVILCPRLPLYFDFVQDSAHVSGRKWDERYNAYLDVYHFPENAILADLLVKKNILGLQANLWTETVISKRRLQYLIFPRMAALAEAGWTEALAKNDTSFNTRLRSHLVWYGNANVYYYNPFNPTQHPEPVDVVKDKDSKD
jgi:hexosaminidase